MPDPKTRRYAARLNAFKIGADIYWPGRNRITTVELLERAASVPGLNAADLNYPDHFDGLEASDLTATLDRLGMELNGLAMRYYTEPAFKLGALTNPDPEVRRKAIDLTKKGLDTLAEMGGPLMTIWLGEDGFDYSFQIDYRKAWDDTVTAFQELASHNPDLDISIEYKPNEPRSFALMPDVATTLLAIKEVDAPNMGVTLDFAHVLYADEMPAHAAALVARHSRLLGVHLNDGYGKRDDGLMVGTVHPIQTVELLVQLIHSAYSGVIYFDTFPDLSGLDPVREAGVNISVMARFQAVAERLAGREDLAQALANQDATASQHIVQTELFGAGRED